MKWELQKKQTLEGDVLEFHLKIYPLDMMKVQLDSFDRLLLKDCGASESCADKLLALETLVRRIERS